MDPNGFNLQISFRNAQAIGLQPLLLPGYERCRACQQ